MKKRKIFMLRDGVIYKHNVSGTQFILRKQGSLWYLEREEKEFVKVFRIPKHMRVLIKQNMRRIGVKRNESR
jgi:hypothetical protein